MSAAGFLIIIVGFAFLWLVVMRPQKRRQAEQQRMIANLELGDEVLTAGGMYGTVTALSDDVVTLEVASGIELRVARRAVAGVTRDEPEVVEADEVEELSEEPDAPDAENHG